MRSWAGCRVTPSPSPQEWLPSVPHRRRRCLAVNPTTRHTGLPFCPEYLPRRFLPSSTQPPFTFTTLFPILHKHFIAIDKPNNPSSLHAMSFPSFDPSQGQPAPFTENGNSGLTQGQPPIQNMQQNMPSMQQAPQGSDAQAPFQGQGAMEQGQGGSTGAPDSKTTLW